MHDGGNGTGHHWAYINTETSSINIQDEDKTWVKCNDASVVACTEEEVFSDEALVYSLIYVNADLETLDIPSADDIIPSSLKVTSIEADLYNHRHRCLLYVTRSMF
jgi:hypothetical protein